MRKKRLLILAGVLLLVLVIAGVLRRRGPEFPQAPATTLIRMNAAPDAGTPDGRVYLYNARPRPGKGLFDAYIATGPHADRLHGRRLLPPWPGNRGAADVTDDGRYVLLVTARGPDRAKSRSQPGKGFGDSVDIYDRRTRRLTTIVRGGCPSCVRGVIWPRFGPDPDGAGPREPAAIHWSEMQKPPWQACCFGDWRQHITALAYDPATGAPRAAGDRVWDNPDGKAHIYETYGWIPGTDRVVFMSDNDVPRKGRGLFYGQLFTLPASAFTPTYQGSRSPEPERFTAPFHKPDGSPVQANHEFAHFEPEHPGWLYTSVAFHSKLGTMDLWRYRYDAAGHPTGERQRVTYFGGTPAGFGRWDRRRRFPDPSFKVVGGMAPAPDGGWIAGVCGDITCERIAAYRLPATP